jgi:hypothetical protein
MCMEEGRPPEGPKKVLTLLDKIWQNSTTDYWD